MKSLTLTGMAVVVAAISTPALAENAPQSAGSISRPAPAAAATPRWGPRVQGRWGPGMRAPGGWVAYRRPTTGWVLPSYWINPSYYIANYGLYGLPAPRAGYGWSRYYDDAVLTDSNGRVYDSRSGIAWDRYEGGYAQDDARPAPPPVARRDDGVGGAAIGAVVGGIAGNRIAGRGNRTVGTVVGAGVGALAGAAIDKAEDAPRRGQPRNDMRDGRTEGFRDGPPPRRDDRYALGRDDDGVTYDGKWVGAWRGADGKEYAGEYSGTYTGSVPPPPGPHMGGHPGPGIAYDAPPLAHGAPMPNNSASNVTSYTQPGYYAGGYYYPGATVTTVTFQPAVTTTTVEESYVTRKVAKPRARQVAVNCRCK